MANLAQAPFVSRILSAGIIEQPLAATWCLTDKYFGLADE
jgi:hypothetical protein